MNTESSAGVAAPGTGHALCRGAFTIINGIATGHGGACGVDLRLLARFHLTKEPGTVEFEALGPGAAGGIDDRLARACARRLLSTAGALDTMGARVETVSEIPPSRGLKSSSAAANAIVMAGLEALGVHREPLEVVDIGVDCAYEAGVTLTGAYDDAVATMFGGAVLTDNERRRILSWMELREGLEVLFLVPERRIEKSTLTREAFAPARELVQQALELARAGDLAGAITMNGRAYAPLLGVEPDPVEAVLAAGAWAAGMTGTGPAIAVLTTADATEAVLAALASYIGTVIRTRVSTVPGSVVTQGMYERLREEITGGDAHG